MILKTVPQPPRAIVTSHPVEISIDALDEIAIVRRGTVGPVETEQTSERLCGRSDYCEEARHNDAGYLR